MLHAAGFLAIEESGFDWVDMETKAELLERLSQAVEELVVVCRQLPDPESAVYDGWTAKDVLGHVTFWHESFARNLDDLVHDRQPNPLRGKLGDLNQRGVEELRTCSLEKVIGRLLAAQRSVATNILSPKLIRIPYRKGSHDYTPEEHLTVTANHIQGHLTAIQRQGRKKGTSVKRA